MTDVGTVDDARGIVAARVRESEIDVAVFRDVLVSAQVSDIAQIAAFARPEQRALIRTRVAAEHLAGCFEEDPGIRNQPRHRKAGVADAVFAAYQVVDHERTVGPGQNVIVERVHLAERRAHLANFCQQSSRQRRERDKPFLDIHALFSERNEEVGARVRIDDRLERRFRLVHLQRTRMVAQAERIRLHAIVAGGAEKVADHRHVGIEDLRSRCRRTVHRQLAARTARAFSAGRHLRR